MKIKFTNTESKANQSSGAEKKYFNAKTKQDKTIKQKRNTNEE